MRGLFCALVFTLGATVAVSAEEVKPIHAKSITLGAIHGIAYYTVEPEGFRVVTTVAAGEATLRIISTLGRDQKVILSVPSTEGAPETQIEYVRLGDQLHVNGPLLNVNGPLLTH